MRRHIRTELFVSEQQRKQELKRDLNKVFGTFSIKLKKKSSLFVEDVCIPERGLHGRQHGGGLDEVEHGRGRQPEVVPALHDSASRCNDLRQNPDCQNSY